MPALHKSRWIITDQTSGRRRETRYLLSEAEALSLDPHAEPVPGSLMVIVVPDDPMALSTSSWQRSEKPTRQPPR